MTAEFINRGNAEAEARMKQFRQEAKRDVAVGDSGMHYFYGKCVVTELSEEIVTLRDESARIHRSVRKFWFGLK